MGQGLTGKESKKMSLAPDIKGTRTRKNVSNKHMGGCLENSI
jgi:hypothetical protein